MSFRIKEAAAKLGVSSSTLRRLEEEGWISPSRTPGGHRVYTDKMLTELRVKLRLNPEKETPILPFLDGITVGE